MDGNTDIAVVWQNVLAQLNQIHGERTPRSGDGGDQLENLRAALRDSPRDPDRYLALAQCCKSRNRYEEAIEVLQSGIGQCRRQAALHHAYLTILQQTGRTADLLRAAEEAVRALPWDLSLRFRNAILLPIVYDDEEEIEFFRARFADGLSACIAGFPLGTREAVRRALAATASDTPFYLPYQGHDVLPLQREYGEFMHRIMAACYPQWSAPLPMPPAGDRLRIGFVSACFQGHSVTKTHGGWLKGLRETCDVYAYYVGVKTDASTEQIRGYCREFRHFPYDFERICRTILDDRLHVLVFPDIGMHAWTTQLAALRLAPVQCASWGQPVTSGLPTVDYYLSSALMEPANGQDHYSEELVPLAGTGIHYDDPLAPRESLTKTRGDFGLGEDAVVFLCCQSLYKYLPRYDRILVEIAKRVPGAQFAMVSPNHLLAARFLARLEREFIAAGVDFADRVVMLPHLDALSYWNLNLVADIFLDSLAWSGCNTTLEAIGCGLPVVSCPGAFMRGRHSYAILTAMGVEETIAADEAAYVDIAVRLATDVPWRQHVAGLMVRNRSRLYADRACIEDLENFFRRTVQTRVAAS